MYNKLTVTRASLEDAVYIAPVLRSADRAELEAVTGLNPLTSIMHGIGTGRTWVFKDGETPVALFGVVPFTKTIGLPWMVATDALLSHKKFFLRHSKEYISKMLSLYPDGLLNYIDCRNEAHIRFIKHFGFQIDGLTNTYGVAQLPFLRFSMNLKGLPTCVPQPQS